MNSGTRATPAARVCAPPWRARAGNAVRPQRSEADVGVDRAPFAPACFMPFPFADVSPSPVSDAYIDARLPRWPIAVRPDDDRAALDDRVPRCRALAFRAGDRRFPARSGARRCAQRPHAARRRPRHRAGPAPGLAQRGGDEACSRRDRERRAPGDARAFRALRARARGVRRWGLERLGTRRERLQPAHDPCLRPRQPRAAQGRRRDPRDARERDSRGRRAARGGCAPAPLRVEGRRVAADAARARAQGLQPSRSAARAQWEGT